uniref:Caspase 10 n=1 Tax=Sphenodon punctatus TaxID=8508 RepID=A0A8D0GD01_SPHPU
MEEDTSMKFHQQLLAIDENLGKEEVEALKFLCSDLIPYKKLEAVESAQDIFQFLMAKDILNKGDTFLLAEILYRIKCHFLLQKLGFTKEQVQENLHQKGKVSQFRQMLYELSEDITSENLKNAIFLLRDQLPKKQTNLTALEFLTLLEKQGLLAENNLQVLEKICKNVSPDLLRKVNNYKWKSANLKMSFSLQLNQQMFCCFWGLLVSSLTSSRTPPPKKSIEHFFYKMDGSHRGYCLIINNDVFMGGLNERKGSFKDAEELQHVFTWLGLNVRTYNNLTSAEIKNIMDKWKYEDHKNSDCFVCCILSHGKSGTVYGTDEKQVRIRTLMSYFLASQCPQLAEKPKLFFIQACQGEEIQRAAYLQTDAQNPALLSTEQIIFPPEAIGESIPDEADFLLGMATVDGYASFRHVLQGTWYIQALCNKLKLLVPRGEDILSILTEVNEDVSKRTDTKGTKKQMPQPAYTLRKKLIFPVPINPPPSQQQ